MQALSKRLTLAASFVKKGGSVCDVGTDHGYLPLFLYKSGKVKSVCATEINIKPLENAKKTFMAENCGEIPLYLCDGLEKINRDMADTVIIAGMGGEVISGIIERAPFLKDESVDLILQPMTAAKEIRIYLAENGFTVKKEKAVCENGKVYSVMLAAFTGKKRSIDVFEQRIGKLLPDCEDNIVYIKRQRGLCSKLCDSIKSIPEKRQLFSAESAALGKLNRLLSGEK